MKGRGALLQVLDEGSLTRAIPPLIAQPFVEPDADVRELYAAHLRNLPISINARSISSEKRTTATPAFACACAVAISTSAVPMAASSSPVTASSTRALACPKRSRALVRAMAAWGIAVMPATMHVWV